ncbi:MAG: hypothetical protein J3R72DRAFT_474777 [Linnemannia gamsii]|nr:MAG: hypothetical protein J3R72DRAFT_474777 [Linnemannia gamsii]
MGSERKRREKKACTAHQQRKEAEIWERARAWLVKDKTYARRMNREKRWVAKKGTLDRQMAIKKEQGMCMSLDSDETWEANEKENGHKNLQGVGTKDLRQICEGADESDFVVGIRGKQNENLTVRKKMCKKVKRQYLFYPFRSSREFAFFKVKGLACLMRFFEVGNGLGDIKSIGKASDASSEENMTKRVTMLVMFVSCPFFLVLLSALVG